ncbi:MAG: L,D-transpeptidase family protein [Verrucomicrobiales bacterium]
MGRRLATTVVLLATALFSGCATTGLQSGQTVYLGDLGGAPIARDQPHKRETSLPDTTSYWDGDGVTGSPSITIDLGEQRALFYKGGELVGVSAISTGREGYNTPAGNFKLTQKDIDHRSNLYGDYVDSEGNVVMGDIGVNTHKAPPGTHFLGAPMFYFMRVHGAVGMHAGFLPGYAASHGCIRMPSKMAKTFYDNAPSGTPIRVTY